MTTSFDLDLSRYQLGWADDENYVFRPEKGISANVVDQMSWWKGEPEWMRQARLRSLRMFERKPMAPWFAKNMPDIDFDEIYYYIKPTSAGVVDEWDELPEQMKATYEKLGIPEAERKYLAGVTAQYECLRGSTLVWTTQGMKPIKAMEPGDEVFSLDEATRQIVVEQVVGQARVRRQGDLRDPRRHPGHRRIRQPSVPRPAGRTPARSPAGPVPHELGRRRRSPGRLTTSPCPLTCPSSAAPRRWVPVTSIRRSASRTPTCAGSSASTSATATSTIGRATGRSRSPSTPPTWA